MRRGVAICVGLVLALAGLAAGARAAWGPPVTVGVGLREFRIAVYRPLVHRGAVKLAVTNRGEDVHDVVVRRAGRTLASTRSLRSGSRAALRLTLRRAGRYELVCLVADHARRGMRATLRVR